MKRLRAVFWALAVLALVLAVGLSVRRSVAGAVRVAGSSMRPTLQDGDVALVTRFDYRERGPERGAVVECRFPGRDGAYIKRVVGLPGERIAFSGGTLSVDGAPVEEPYVSGPTEDYSIALGPDEYLVLGDNRPDSYDSRMADMGPIRREAILGRVRWILWPVSRLGAIH